MENVRNRINVALLRATEEEAALQRRINKPTYKRSVMLENDLVAVESSRVKVTLTKPIYVGAAILELSKLHMYSFFYERLKSRYGDKARLIYTDTDSLVLSIETDDVYEDMKEDADIYDTSNYPAEHPLFTTVNKKVVGKFKDEMGGIPITEFVALRSKMYAYETLDGSAGKRAKGVKKDVLRRSITIDDYRTCLIQETQLSHTMNMLRSRLHQVHGERVRKTTLSAFDSKRYIMNDGIHTLPYGHKDIV